MCFSATASFTSAAFTGVVGVVALLRVTQAREIPLAAVPLLFGVQQAVEGCLWLLLPQAPHSVWVAELTLCYMLFAQVIWPVYAPAASWTMETDPLRRRLMAVCIAIGAVVAAYLLWRMLSGPREAMIVNRCIVYHSQGGFPFLTGAAYLAASTLPLLLSTRRTVFALGAIVTIGAAVAYVFYWEAFQSVWCYFAAAGSVVILAHFETARRWGAQTVAG